jgi:hypothetical protein
MHRSTLRTLILFRLIGLLFPMAFLGILWPALGRIFNTVFASDWMQILMHSFLYAVLACLLSLWIEPGSARGYLVLAGLILRDLFSGF